MSDKDERADRLAAQLRANLKRRKERQRAAADPVEVDQRKPASDSNP